MPLTYQASYNHELINKNICSTVVKLKNSADVSAN